MGKSPTIIADKLCSAINHKFNAHVVLNSRKFYKPNIRKAVKLYDVKDSYISEEGQFVTKRLFTTSSASYACCFLQELMKNLEGDREYESSNAGYNRSRIRGDVPTAIDYMVTMYGED